MLRWQLDAEQNCDVYVCMEEWQLHSKNIYCMVYSPSLNCLITGSEDNTIHLHYLHSKSPPRVRFSGWCRLSVVDPCLRRGSDCMEGTDSTADWTRPAAARSIQDWNRRAAAVRQAAGLRT